MAKVELEVADALRAAAISAYWEGFADGAKSAALRAKDAQIHELMTKKSRPAPSAHVQAQPPEEPAV